MQSGVAEGFRLGGSQYVKKFRGGVKSSGAFFNEELTWTGSMRDR